MGRWATGVSIVTAREDGRNYGLTVNALVSVALSPPLLLISLMQSADSTPVIQRTRRFAVNFLAVDQRLVSDLFARAIPSPEKFTAVSFTINSRNLPILSGTLGSVECEIRSEYPVADHLLLIGEALDMSPGRDVAPLLFYRGRYAEGDGENRLKFPPPRE
jgi:3-hydroxy-9,10-secoandrosta-1,3,5(10)-triene-9,17-dione monooxygenase reductase component